MVLEQLKSMQKVNLDTDLTPFTKINPKQLIELNVRYPEDSTGEVLDDLGFSDGFLETTPKLRFMKKNPSAALH